MGLLLLISYRIQILHLGFVFFLSLLLFEEKVENLVGALGYSG